MNTKDDGLLLSTPSVGVINGPELLHRHKFQVLPKFWEASKFNSYSLIADFAG